MDDLSIIIEPSPISDEALRIIKLLQGKLQKTRSQIRETAQAAERINFTVEERKGQCNSLFESQQKGARNLEKLRQERDQDLRCQQALADDLEQYRAEMVSAQEHAAKLVPREELDDLTRELQSEMSKLAEAREEGREIRERLEAAWLAERRKEKRNIVQAQEEARKLEPLLRKKETIKEAKQISVRARAEQRERCSKQQIDKVAQLTAKKEQLQTELAQLSKQNASLEHRMEALRNKNRSLEAQQRRLCQANEETQNKLRKEIRRRAYPLRVLTDLLRDPNEHLDQEPPWNSTAMECNPPEEFFHSSFGDHVAHDVPVSDFEVHRSQNGDAVVATPEQTLQFCSPRAVGSVSLEDPTGGDTSRPSTSTHGSCARQERLDGSQDAPYSMGAESMGCQDAQENDSDVRHLLRSAVPVDPVDTAVVLPSEGNSGLAKSRGNRLDVALSRNQTLLDQLARQCGSDTLNEASI